MPSTDLASVMAIADGEKEHLARLADGFIRRAPYGEIETDEEGMWRALAAHIASVISRRPGEYLPFLQWLNAVAKDPRERADFRESLITLIGPHLAITREILRDVPPAGNA